MTVQTLHNEHLRQFSDAVRAASRGRWDIILRGLAHTMGPAIDLHCNRQTVKSHTFCPVHTGKNGDAFRCADDFKESGGVFCNSCGSYPDGFATLMWLKGYHFAAAFAEVAEFLGISRESGSVIAPVRSFIPPPPDPDEERRIAAESERQRNRIAEVWNSAISIHDKNAIAGQNYLRKRMLNRHALEGAAVRFAPRMKYVISGGRDIGYYPCLLQLFIHPLRSCAVGVNRIFCTEDGSKPPHPEQCKKPMAMPKDEKLNGCHVPLTSKRNSMNVLAIGEGVETMLSVKAAYRGYDISVWATTTAGLLEAVEIPSTVQTLLICADKDRSGRGAEAAWKLQQRAMAAGIHAVAFEPGMDIPPDKDGYDWNDVWIDYKEAGFPPIDSFFAKKTA